MDSSSIKNTARSELFLFITLLFVGVIVVPLGIYIVGGLVFGAYAGQGFWDFFGTLQGDIRGGETVVLFLILSPYLVWQIVRGGVVLFRRL